MTLRTRTLASGTAIAAIAALAVSMSATPAQARWRFHDTSVGETMTAPLSGTRDDTCANRLLGRTGWSTYLPDFQPPLPDAARTRVGYEVWRAPAGVTSFADAQVEDGRVYFQVGETTRRARLVGTVLTPRRAPLTPPQPWGLDPGHLAQQFVMTSAPISIRLTGVRVGDRLGLTPTQYRSLGAFTDLRAMNCKLPVLEPRVDLRPGVRPDVVRPFDSSELVPVRVFGSPRLKVRHIDEIHLGEAEPSQVDAPQDVNGEGRADRVYHFTQGATDVQCYDSGVRLTGHTSDRVRFQRRIPITIEGCLG